MITPRFKLTQDDIFVIVTIQAPYTNVKETEIEYDENFFIFSSKPYFLRLHLPANVKWDTEMGKTHYDTDSGTFTVYVPKKNKGEHFPNLDMLSELIKPQRLSAAPLISEMPSTSEETGTEDVYFEQKISDEEENEESIFHLYGYGFAWQRHGILGKIRDEIGVLIDVIDPEKFAIDCRSDFCRELDEEQFNSEYYLADLFTPDPLQKEAMDFVLTDEMLQINDLDREQLKDLPIRYLGTISPETNNHLALSLIDLCFAFAYDLRTTGGESNIESGWTIAKLAPTLSVLTRWQNAQEALVAAVRRSLVYPVCRNWELAMKVADDVEMIFNGGRATILHCLLNIFKIFNTAGEFRYLFNQLYMNDYCLWIQAVHPSVLENLKSEYQETKQKLDKFSVGLDLDYIEAEARMKQLDLDQTGDIPSILVGASLNESELKQVLDSDDEPELEKNE